MVLQAHLRGLALQSDFTRTNVALVAMAASMGLISTRIFGDLYGREWHPTVAGLEFIEAFPVTQHDEDQFEFIF